MQQSRWPLSGLGPRARRRLTWLAALAGALLVVAGVIYHHAKSGGSAIRQQAAGHHVNLALENNLGIPYGSTPRQVLGQLGSPTAKRGNCWVYQGQRGRIRGRVVNSAVDAFKFCFAPGPLGGNVVARIFQHSPAQTIDHKKLPAGWFHITVE
ncbi:MAG TPA: hypothetical protein VHV52_01905 [Gaiellaceae bacterium]|nr:hypothetical protein [Gaiellaceae bacterium]